MAGSGYCRPVLVATDNECDEVMTLPQVKRLSNGANRFIAEEIPKTTAVDIAAGVTASDESQETAANDLAIIHIESNVVEPVVSIAAPISGQSCVEVRRSVRERTQPKHFDGFDVQLPPSTVPTQPAHPSADSSAKECWAAHYEVKHWIFTI
ncbi:hypothetical protein COLO4_33338 [Corchorus olitorius]|uniref:Uncharacterized protein n=1 Tax=Corchorus olitorius TaxID=93759 RepID=A0A1R3GUL3_9ROSI|nr:hypothetical protein COLO4_33338 [Corchorus olitorius]